MTEKELAILNEVVRIAASRAAGTDCGYVARARTILLQEDQSLKAAKSLEPRLAEDISGHVFLARPEDHWMVSRYMEVK